MSVLKLKQKQQPFSTWLKITELVLLESIEYGPIEIASSNS